MKLLKALIQRHLKFTGSEVARRVLLNWHKEGRHFVKVFPHEYARALREAAAKKTAAVEEAVAIKAAGGLFQGALGVWAPLLLYLCCALLVDWDKEGSTSSRYSHMREYMHVH